METQIELLLLSYSLVDILELNDLTPEYVLKLLIREGKLELTEYFEDYDNDEGYS